MRGRHGDGHAGLVADRGDEDEVAELDEARCPSRSEAGGLYEHHGHARRGRWVLQEEEERGLAMPAQCEVAVAATVEVAPQ